MKNKILLVAACLAAVLTSCGSEAEVESESVQTKKDTSVTSEGAVLDEVNSSDTASSDESTNDSEAETEEQTKEIDPLEVSEDPADYTPEIKLYQIGSSHAGILSQNDELYLWGSEASGKLANGNDYFMDYECDPIKVMSDVASFSLGINNTEAVTNSGKLYMWGTNKHYELGLGDIPDDNISSPQFVMDNVKEVSCGAMHCGAVTLDGELYVWGNNEHGETGTENSTENTPVKIMDGVKTAVMGYEYSAAITEDGSLYMWGSNSHGQLGDSTTEDRSSPVKILDNVKKVDLGETHSAAITENGDLYVWGSNSASKLGLGVEDDMITVPTFLMANVKDVSLGVGFSAAVTESGELYLWGSDSSGQQGDGNGRAFAATEQPTLLMENVDSVYASSSGENASCVCFTNDGRMFAWGTNTWGQLGTGGTKDHYEPVEIVLSELFENTLTV
mgnify:CR=1 FL=1